MPSATPQPGQYAPLVGTSKPMRDLLSQIETAAETDANVCIAGERGTGKKLAARAIHYASRRAPHPLIVFDCAATPASVMASELVGHTTGAFPAAVSDRDGAVQLADGGTLVLDDVGALLLPFQATLLQVLQRREVRRVGDARPRSVDVRLLTVTSTDLGALVAAGTLREDLYALLTVVPVSIPPLRERPEDIPFLVDHFLQQFNRTNVKQIQSVCSRTLGALLQHHWPGNVRELEQCIERTAMMTTGPVLDLPALSQVVPPRTTPAPQAAPGAPRALHPARAGGWCRRRSSIVPPPWPGISLFFGC